MSTHREKATDTHTERVQNVQRKGVWPKMHIEASTTTVFLVTACHPRDGHEFGVAIPLEGQHGELPDDELGAVIRGMNDYIETHP